MSHSQKRQSTPMLALAGAALSSPTRTDNQPLLPSGHSQCKALATAGAQPGKFVRSLDQCTERFTSELSCNGYKVLLSRVDQPGLDFWDVLLRIRSENSTTEDYPPPTVAVEGRATEQISHNAAYLCNEDKLVLYGGRIKPDGRPGHYPGMLRMEGTLSDSGVAWSEPMLILDADKAKSLNCTDGRRNHFGICEFDGKLSVVEFKGNTLIFGRLNPKTQGFRHVQMTRHPSDDPTQLAPFQSLVFDEYDTTVDNNIYFLNVKASTDKLIGLFPAVIDKTGGIYYSESTDGVHWLKPHLVMGSQTFGVRNDDYPVDGFISNQSGLFFSVDHEIVLEHGEDFNAEASAKGLCTPPHSCQYEIHRSALEELMGRG